MGIFNFQNIQKLPTLSGVASRFLRGKWTLYDTNSLSEIVTFTSFLGYKASETSFVPAHEIEEGSFTSYNKINNPGEFSVTLAISGSNWDISRAIEKLNQYKKSTKLVNLVLPFQTYLNLNLVDFSHGISEGQAINQLIVELNLKEIAEVRKQYTSYVINMVRNAGDTNITDRGRQQAQEIKQPSLLSSIKNKILGV